MTARPCAVCATDIEFDTNHNYPAGALWFTSSGNYGSRLFDPITGDQQLEILICDDCVKAMGDRVKAFTRHTMTHRRSMPRPWEE